MNFTVINDGFQCLNCRAKVSPQKGGCRNHCPHCLHSLHVDAEFPGDRASKCHGLMAPIGVTQSGKKGWILLHQCMKCGKNMRNKTAAEDDMELITKLCQTPIQSPLQKGSSREG